MYGIVKTDKNTIWYQKSGQWFLGGWWAKWEGPEGLLGAGGVL